jgi:prevent-host-death family protein
MKTVNLHFAKTHLSRLVDDAVGGDDIVIAKAGKPLVRLVRIATSDKPRQLGSLTGKIRESKDCKRLLGGRP